MSDTTLRASIYTMLSSVSGTGMVYDSEQPCADETFINAFQNGAGGAYFGWDLTRVAVKVEYLNHRYQWTHTYRMRGFYGLKSIALSEKAFQAVVDAVLTEFTQNQISGTVRKTFAHADKVIPLTTLFNVAFHYAEITIEAPETVDPSDVSAGVPLTAIDVQYFKQPENAAMTAPPDAEDTISFEGGT